MIKVKWIAIPPMTRFIASVAKEIERKFLVRDDAWRAGAERALAIRQFYLVATADRTVRVRIVDADSAMLTLKFGAVALARDEFEYAISLAEAAEMQAFAIGRVIAKTRHHVRHGGRLYEVDVFDGELGGLVIAELEDADAASERQLPPWLGREVTGEPAYYNAALALAAEAVAPA
jgi:CYTH domain-containing protein